MTDSATTAKPSESNDVAGAMSAFGPATRAWFEGAFTAPTTVQARGWPTIATGQDVLLIAPTGSGKTLAAFLYAIDQIACDTARAAARAEAEAYAEARAQRKKRTKPAKTGYSVIYISPLKALVYDVERNLRAPLYGIGLAAERLGIDMAPIQVDVRTGDTSQQERRRQLKKPGDILVTTPESIYLLLGGQARENLVSAHTIIIDEIHAIAPSKRGTHMALSLERLRALQETPAQRVGLSATVRPPETVAAFLTGSTPATIIDAGEPPKIDLEIIVPLDDMTQPNRQPASEQSGSILAIARAGEREQTENVPKTGVWQAIEPRIYELVMQHRSTIVFVNSRGLAERLAQRLNDMHEEMLARPLEDESIAGSEGTLPDVDVLARAHHGSISHRQRTTIEETLKSGQLRAIVATSSLELGIDMGAVDLVVQVESPDSTARGLQRIGRAGHHVGAVSRGKIFPKFRGDILESAVIARRMISGEIESIAVPTNALDVLAQQIVAMCSTADWRVDELKAVVRGAYPYRELSDDAFEAVLDMLSGRYPSTEFADLRPRINWDRATNTLSGRKGARFVSMINGGTIPDRGLYGVHIGPDGPKVGELDEEMVYEARSGETFFLGASTWRILEITRDRVIVEPAPGEPGKLPFWHGDGPGRPIETGRAIGAFLRELDALPAKAQDGWLAAETPLDALARKNLLAYVDEQREATDALPTDRTIVVERFRDELGDWRVCLLTPFGARVHAPWALALEGILSARAGFNVQTMWSDDGLVLRFADTDEVPSFSDLMIEPEELEEIVVERLAESALFAAMFRENAARSLLLPRRNAKGRTPLWQQRLRAQNLMAVARRYPAFPVILETYRACLKDVFDLGALTDLLGQIQRREIVVVEAETPTASPFARSLVFAYVAAFLYEGDAPLAERRVQALTLDKNLLRELLGQDELRSLLDRATITSVEEELQHLTSERHARHADALHDMLRRLGALDEAGIAARCADDPSAWISALSEARRIVEFRVAGALRWVAAEDAGLYRDALGAMPPSGIPQAFLEASERPLEALVMRYARTHGPFSLREAALAFDLHPEPVRLVLEQLVGAGRVLEGGFRPGLSGQEYCDPEVLRRIRRRTLAKLRKAVEPVDAAVLGRYLADFHGMTSPKSGRTRLLDVIEQLEGQPLPWSELEGRILPARVRDYHPSMLDELGAMGQLVWVGRGSLGQRDGRVALYRREHAAVLLTADTGDDPPCEPIHDAIRAHLDERGASFLTELKLRVKAESGDELHRGLWDLVWSGLVTNDTFTPLRELARGKRKKKATRSSMSRGRRGLAAGRRDRSRMTAGGRWTLVSDAVDPETTGTERLHALAFTLLERYGVVSKEMAAAESVTGGFVGLYKMLRELEQTGRVRRGYFVEGLSGAQFALPGAIDRLRTSRESDDRTARVMAATDPANPWGSLLPWPTPLAPDSKPRRAAGASVVLVDGALALWANKRGTRLATFEPMRDEATAIAAFAALVSLARTAKGRMLTLEQIDGGPARQSPWSRQLSAAGFSSDYKGLTLTA